MPLSVLRNTLLSQAGIEKILSLPKEDHVYESIREILQKFQDIRKFASEIHTEIHLVRPILKLLGFAYESKPKFYEDHVKGPDVALFSNEEERVKSAQVWGTEGYYDHMLGILLLKRYGRNLHEGIGGFYLEFENRIPVYQAIYLLKKGKAPWAILTNGKHWMLIKRPLHFEKRMVEIDIEHALFDDDTGTLHSFYQLFSLRGLTTTIPETLEEERMELIERLSERRRSLQASLHNLKKKADIYPVVINTYKEFFQDKGLPSAESYLKERHVELEAPQHDKTRPVNEYNMSDIFSYLLTRKGIPAVLNIEEIILGDTKKRRSKEELLSLRILDMTPCLGNLAVQLVESLAYLCFVLPYRERNTFIAEWEDEKELKMFILDRVLYGIERSHLCLDIAQNSLKTRFGFEAKHYRLGNPLIGMALKDITGATERKDQMGLFNRPPGEVISDFRSMYRTYFSLSEKIKEDMEIRNELEKKLKIFGQRIQDVMDLSTATYFIKSVDTKRVHDMLFAMDGEESTWEAMRRKSWFVDAKEIARKNGFFHLEIEFPVLLNDAFDCIFAQPGVSYIWEEDLPLAEATKAYIKRGMTYLKEQGKLVLITDGADNSLISDLKRSRRFDIEASEDLIVLTKKNPA
jgi:hypothetical protein